VYVIAVPLFLVTGGDGAFDRGLHAQARAEAPGLDSVSTASASSGAAPPSWAPSLSICSRSLGRPRRRCCRFTRADILVTGPWGLGLLRSSTAVGALAMALYWRANPMTRRAGSTDVRRRRAVSALLTIVFGVSRSFALSLAALALMAPPDMVSVGSVRRSCSCKRPMRCAAVCPQCNALSSARRIIGEFESGVTAAWFASCRRW